MERSVPCSIASRSEKAEFMAHGCVFRQYVIPNYCVTLLSVHDMKPRKRQACSNWCFLRIVTTFAVRIADLRKRQCKTRTLIFHHACKFCVFTQLFRNTVSSQTREVKTAILACHQIWRGRLLHAWRFLGFRSWRGSCVRAQSSVADRDLMDFNEHHSKTTSTDIFSIWSAEVSRVVYWNSKYRGRLPLVEYRLQDDVYFTFSFLPFKRVDLEVTNSKYFFDLHEISVLTICTYHLHSG